ncbi:MAG: response regulator [Elusimicrobia bacterium]|nr:response regulator [Elusimicrobiota bacterium]
MENPVPSGDSGLLQCLVDAVADPIFVKDRDHRWVLFNEAFVVLLGRPREQLIGRSDYEFFPKAQADVFRRQDELVFETGRENSNEEMLTDAKGQTHVLVTRKTLWTSPSGKMYLIGVIRDITNLVDAAEDIKRSKERLERAQKLETMGYVAGGVAHDFNNLLAAIRGCADLLLENLPKGHPSRVDAEEIRRAGERAAALTRQLLSFGRRPGGMARPVDLLATVTGMRGILARLLPPRVRLELDLPKSLGPILADPGLVEQVLLNLVVNAGEAMPDGGQVTVEIAPAPKGGAGVRAPCARLTVRDRGVGMTEDVRGRIFEPFFTTKESGSGLGLPTVAETVRRCDGGIEVESAPGKGAAFHVYWPLAAVKAPGRTPPADKKRGRVLVVDDDEAIRRFSVRCLEREGYEVLSASDPAEALRIDGANEGLFDLLLIDVAMPRMRGPELAERLRRRQPGARVLFTSGRRREDCGIAAGGDSYFLPKPFTAQDLTESVSAARRAGGGPSRRVRRRGPAPSRRKRS